MPDGVVISDLSRARPSSALSRDPAPDQWGIYDYETADLAGRAVYCRPHFNPPPLAVPLGVRGWHRLFLGIHYGHGHNSHAAKLGLTIPEQFLWVKLSGQRSYELIEPELYGRKDEPHPEKVFGMNDVAEVLWCCADLSDRELHVAPRRTARFPHEAAGLAWVRLEPMAPAEVAMYRARLGQPDTRRLIYIGDSDLHDGYPLSADEVHYHLQPLQDSDFFLVLWSTALGDVCYFPSRQYPRAHVLTGGVSPYGFVSPAAAAGDTLQNLADTVHEMGLRVHGLMRPVASRLAPLHWPRAEGDLFHRCPEVRQVGRRGAPVGHYSFAHPLVRETFTGVLREQVEHWPLDGVHVLFNRGWPFVSFEPAVVADFTAEYGEDPHGLDPMDPRWWRHQARYVSRFVQDVREMLDEVGQRRGQRLEFSVTVMAGVEQSLALGLDVSQWLARRWVDRAIVHPCWLPNRWLDTEVRADLSVTPQRIAEVKALAGETCRVYPDVYPRYMPATDYPRRAEEYYAAGADGLCFWDTYCRVPRKSEWHTIRQLGHVADLPQLAEEARGHFRVYPLTSTAGMSLAPEHTPATNG
ncbi:family 10 glycosylhydrolase [bacterium]|nr:family 10 glycosylhydrolase [bacterium]